MRDQRVNPQGLRRQIAEPSVGSYEETYEMFKTYLLKNEKLGIIPDDEEAVKKAIDDIGKFLGK